ncbi:MAG: CoA-binding protein [Deltaproteobacteria bacterium]|nr:CoA-binding protein [Candidatus Zymogenaceae bacterium]
MNPDLLDSAAALKRILTPSSLAVVGASDNFSNPATNLLSTIIACGFEGDIFAIHPKAKTALGVPVFPSIADLPKPVDLAIIVVPNTVASTVLEDCGKRGIMNAVVITAGYREMGPEGAALEQELLATARKHGIRFTGPNCIGIINTSVKLNCSMFYSEGKPGAMGLVSQSGSYVTQPLYYFSQHGINLSSAVSAGNQSDIDIADSLVFFADDEHTRSVAAYIEGFSDGNKFLEAARYATGKKPVVVLYVGGTEEGSRSGKSHTGAVATDDAIADAVFHQTGVIRAASVGDLFDFAHAFSVQPLPRGNRVAVITNSGGPGTSMVDAAARQGLSIPEFSPTLQKKLRDVVVHTAQVGNPVDITMDFDLEKFFITVPKLVIESGEADAVLFYGVFSGAHAKKKMEILKRPEAEMLDGYDQYLTNLLETFVRNVANSGIPLVAASFNGKLDTPVARMMEMDVPVFPTPERAAAALAAMNRYARWRDEL